MNIPGQRLHNQYVTRPHRGRAADLVSWLGAVQAQEYSFAKWGLGLRLGAGTTDGEIEAAFESGEILRTHVMRPTWHFVAPGDITWMLELTAPRVHAAMATYLRHTALDSRLLVRTTALVERGLAGRRYLTRAELGQELSRAGIALTAMQLSFVTMYAELERVICSGPRRGKTFSYALLSERARAPHRLAGDEALAELVRRFFQSHGPATIHDFAWWSGLKIVDGRRGLEMIGARPFDQDGKTYWSTGSSPRLARTRDRVHLLPIYDEYLVAYRDRVAVPHGPGTIDDRGGTVTFRHALVIDGQVAGTWRRENGPQPSVKVFPLRQLSRAEQRGVDAGIARYERFLGVRS